MKRTTTPECKFCGEPISIQDAAVVYKDFSMAHEDCDDIEECRQANSHELCREVDGQHTHIY